MNPNENTSPETLTDEQKMETMRRLLTARLFDAISDTRKPIKASLVTAATTWLRINGGLDFDPNANRFRTSQNSTALADLAASLPFISPEERKVFEQAAAEESARRERQANAIGAAIERLEDEDGTDDDDE